MFRHSAFFFSSPHPLIRAGLIKPQSADPLHRFPRLAPSPWPRSKANGESRREIPFALARRRRTRPASCEGSTEPLFQASEGEKRRHTAVYCRVALPTPFPGSAIRGGKENFSVSFRFLPRSEQFSSGGRGGFPPSSLLLFQEEKGRKVRGKSSLARKGFPFYMESKSDSKQQSAHCRVKQRLSAVNMFEEGVNHRIC